MGARLKRKAVEQLSHVWLATLVLASIMTILNHGHWLDNIKATTTRLVAFAFYHYVPSFRPALRDAPLIVVIDDELFDTYFKGNSPLDRDKLASLIEHLARSYRPAVLAIDLDLSPGAAPFERRQAPRAIDRALCWIALADEPAKRRCEGALPEDSALDRTSRQALQCRVPVALLYPFKSEHRETIIKNTFWREETEQRLGACVRFAAAEVLHHGGSALYYDPQGITLGVVASRLMEAARGGGDHGRTKHHGPQAISFDVPYQTLLDQRMAAPDGRRVLIQPHYSQGASSTVTLPQPAEPCEDCIVFLGGSWGEDDKHFTALPAMVDGVTVHAAIFHTERGGLKRAHVAEFILEFIIGATFGVIFRSLWIQYVSAGLALHDWPAKRRFAMFNTLAPATDYRRYADFVPRVGYFIAVWATVVAYFVIAIAITVTLLGFNMWSEPAGMVTGLIVHTVLESRGIQELVLLRRGHEMPGGGVDHAKASTENGPSDGPPLRAELGRAIWFVRLLFVVGLIGCAAGIVFGLIE